MMKKPRTQKHEGIRNTLADELKPIFDELVADYQSAAVRRYGQRFVAYIVLADLVRVGWRHTADSIEDHHTEKHEQISNTLPDELKPTFDELVADYKFATARAYGQGVVAYTVLADLVRVGWRRTADPIEDYQTD